MKKSFMLGLVLCTSAAFALDVSPILSEASRTSSDSVVVKGAPVVDAKPVAIERNADVRMSAVGSRTLPAITAKRGDSNHHGARSSMCDNPLYETTDWDGANGLFNSRSGFGYDARCADDADFDSDTTVGGMHFLNMDTPGQTDVTSGDILVLPDTGDCLPNDDDSTAYLNQADVPVCRVDTGDRPFGYYEMMLYSINIDGGLTVPAGKSWWAGRPVHPSGYGYWATSNLGSPTNCDGAFRSPTFGYYSWVGAATQFGSPSDFAFCLTGSGGGAGACCTAGDCADGVDQGDCEAGGGTYQGDGTFCCSTVCPGRAAGCCFEDGHCENLKPADCEAAGGIPQGDENLCRGGLCPLPDFCADSIFNQFGYDGVDGLSAQDSGDIGWIDARSADNAVLAASSDITGAVWQTVDRGNPSVSVADYEFYYTHPSGGPGKLIASGDNVTLDNRVTDGTQIFGGTVWVYKVTTSTVRVATGSYYTMLRPRIEEFIQSFWLTAPGDGVPGYFLSPFFGYSQWTNSEDIFGFAFEFSFCLLGVTGVGPYGACCLDDESRCELMTEEECANAAGIYEGDDTICFPSPCANEPGACCFLDPYGCTDDVNSTECDAQGGEFFGGGTTCADTRCPLPDFCADSLYSQFGYDGFNGLANQDTSSLSWVVAWTTDDAVVARAEVTGVVVQNVTRGNPSVTEEDAFLAYVHPTGGPGKRIVDLDNTTSFIRATDGSGIFGGTVWVSVVDFPASRVVAGNYYTSAREVINEYVQSFLLTSATGGNLESYFQGALFGYPNWTPVSNLLGADYPFSFCLLGTTTNEEWGACCSADETSCTIATEAECRDSGGRYVGTDAPCFPAPCTNTPGACCFLDPFGCTDGLTEGDCTGQGGEFQGGDTTCAETRCPLPDFCADSIHNQLHNGNLSGYGNGDSSAFGYSYRVADDVTLGSNHYITGIVIEDANYDFGSDDNEVIDEAGWAIYNTAGSGPTSIVDSEASVSTFAYAKTGDRLFGFYDLYYLAIYFDAEARVGAGQYYVNGHPRWSATAYHYWNATDIGGGSPGYQSLDGGGSWAQTSYDFSFCLLGRPSDEVWGACCTENDSICSFGTQDECDAAGGEYQGDGVSCGPNPCPNAPGACCLESGECLFVIPAECDAAGGEFQGGDVTCVQVVCPIPDPCDGEHGDVLYNNSTPDGINGLWNADNTNTGYISAWCADDFNPTGDVTLGGIHFYDLRNGAYDGTGDYSVLGDNGDCLPDDGNSYADGQDVPMTSLFTGNMLFGYRVNQNNIDTGAVALGAGRYWILGRPNMSVAAPAYWATAPVTDCQGAFKSPDFGYPDWVHADTQFGRESDFAYCLTGPADPCSGVVLGDSNGDGLVNFDDIDCFVAALVGPDAWADCGTLLPPGAYECANDIDGNGNVDFDDIDPFVICLINETCD